MQWLSGLALIVGIGLVLAAGLTFGPRPDARERAYAAKAQSRSRQGSSAAASTENPPRGWWEIARRTYEETHRDRVVAVAAGVTFSSLLALFPALTAFVSLYGLVNDPAVILKPNGNGSAPGPWSLPSAG